MDHISNICVILHLALTIFVLLPAVQALSRNASMAFWLAIVRLTWVVRCMYVITLVPVRVIRLPRLEQ